MLRRIYWASHRPAYGGRLSDLLSGGSVRTREVCDALNVLRGRLGVLPLLGCVPDVRADLLAVAEDKWTAPLSDMLGMKHARRGPFGRQPPHTGADLVMTNWPAVELNAQPVASESLLPEGTNVDRYNWSGRVN